MIRLGCALNGHVDLIVLCCKMECWVLCLELNYYGIVKYHESTVAKH